jgi:ABC-2 type transport system permease protein
MNQLMCEQRKMSRFSDFFVMLKINILDLKLSFFFQAIFSIFTPLGLLFFLYTNIDSTDIVAVTRVFTGNLLISLTMPSLLLLSSKIAVLKKDGTIDYYNTLPISMNVFIFALLLSFVLSYLPGIITIFAIGAIALNINITAVNVVLLALVLLLSLLSLIGFAVIIGALSPGIYQANAIGNIFFTLFITMSPVLIPEEVLPNFIVVFSSFMPTRHAAILLNGILNNNLSTRDIIISLSVLVIYSVVSYVLLKLSWK